MKRKKNFCCTLLIIVLILSIGIGYAYLSSELNFEVATASISPYIRLCKRATTLHSETCTSSSTMGYCTAGGTSITYGQIGTNGVLTSGDAFDCDVNGDGNYDPETERFYYATDLESDSNIAVLVFYTNTSPDGTRSRTTRPPYHSSNSYSGPRDAASMLPTTTAWPRVGLIKKTSQIYNEKGGTTAAYSTNTTTTHNLPRFTYTTAARLLTYQEYGKITDNSFLWENFDGQYADCIWLNTPQASTGMSDAVWAIDKTTSNVISTIPTDGSSTLCGARPVIEVLKTDMIY